MTPEERERKLALVAGAARRVNQHLNYSTEVQGNMTEAVRHARAEAGAKPLPCDAQRVQKTLDPTEVQALRADVSAVAKSLLGVVRTHKSTVTEQKSEVASGTRYIDRS